MYVETMCLNVKWMKMFFYLTKCQHPTSNTKILESMKCNKYSYKNIVTYITIFNFPWNLKKRVSVQIYIYVLHFLFCTGYPPSIFFFLPSTQIYTQILISKFPQQKKMDARVHIDSFPSPNNQSLRSNVFIINIKTIIKRYPKRIYSLQDSNCKLD